jgi:hypothetical protein
MKIMEDKSLCISLSRKGEIPVKSITLLVATTFSAIFKREGIHKNHFKNLFPNNLKTVGEILLILSMISGRNENHFPLNFF